MKQPNLFVRPHLIALGKEIRAARIHAKIPTGRLAKRAAMSRQGLMKIERGGNVTLGSIILLANALGCQVSDLFPHKAPWNRP